MMNVKIRFDFSDKEFTYQHIRKAYAVGTGTMLVRENGKMVSNRNTKILHVEVISSEQEEEIIKRKIRAQRDYCDTHKVPHFAPKDGVCWCCHKQIYTEITFEKASSELITGCPICARTYCD